MCLWREDGFVVCNCCWSWPAQLSSGPSPAGLITIFYCLRFETPAIWRARSPYIHPPGTWWPSYTPMHWVPFRRLLRLAGIRWRYSNPPPGGVPTEIKVTVRLAVYRRSVLLARSPLRLTTRDFSFNSPELLVLVIWFRHGPHRKRLFHYCVFFRCRGNNVSTELFPSNGCLLSSVYAAVTWQWVYTSQYSLQQNVCCLPYIVSINVLKYIKGAQNFQMQQLWKLEPSDQFV
jgi:hypothetical protein